MRTTVKRFLGLGVLAAATYGAWRAFQQRTATGDAGWEPQPFPYPPQPKVVDTTSPWIEAADSGACPAHHPVKAKLASGIFHLPGAVNYARTPRRSLLSVGRGRRGRRPARRQALTAGR